MGLPLLVLAQTTAPPPVPAPAIDLFSGFEQTILDAFRTSLDTIYRSDQYTLWVAFTTVLASWLFFNRLIIDFAKGFLSGKGSLKTIIMTTALMFFNFFLVMNPKVIGEVGFSIFEFLMGVANGFIIGPAGQSLDLTGMIDQMARSMTDASGINPFNIMYCLTWLLVALATVLLAVIYFVHLVLALFQIYVIFPAFLRFAQAGLFMKETQGWFYTLLGAVLEQMLIPLLGKLAISITFNLMDILFQKISAQNGGGLAQGIANNLEVIMAFVFLLAMGILFQLSVPKLAKLAGVSASGAAKDISGASAAAGLFIAALKPAIGIAKLPISAPVGAAKGAIKLGPNFRRTKADFAETRQMAGNAYQGIRSRFAPRNPPPGPRTPKP
jgi:hypothetical protein